MAQDQVTRLYAAAFNRQPDAAGLQYWETALANGMNIQQEAASFLVQPEFTTLYGSPTDDQFVRELYVNILGRQGEQAGINYWDNALLTDSRGDILNAIAQSPENVQHTADLQDPPPAPVVAPVPPAIQPAIAVPVSVAPVTVTTPIPPVNTAPVDPPAAPAAPTSPTVPSNDITGSLGNPTLNVTGFMSADNVSSFTDVNVGTIDATGATIGGATGTLQVTGALSAVANITVSSVGGVGSVAEIGSGAPTSSIFLRTFGSGPLSKLILDNAPANELTIPVSGGGVGGLLELPNITFNGEKFVPKAGSISGGIGTPGSMELTRGGVVVYTIDSWNPTNTTAAGVGVDEATGYNYIAIG